MAPRNRERENNILHPSAYVVKEQVQGADKCTVVFSHRNSSWGPRTKLGKNKKHRWDFKLKVSALPQC